jgi:DNA-binding NtrC family response regulator
MGRAQVLIVDDEEGVLEVCADALRDLPNVDVIVEKHVKEAMNQLRSQSFDLLLLDLHLPQISGVELLRIARRQDADLPVLILTGFPSLDSAIECMKLGAADYLAKPFVPEVLRRSVSRLIEARLLRKENRLLQRQMQRPYEAEEIVGSSPAIQTTREAIERLAESDVDVLITGETGTGKELAARSVHRRSPRHAARFVPVDCGAIPASLLESEFFGHERGAFTGAADQTMGLVGFAEGGSLFLDEITSLPLPLQAKFLRVLQERKFRRVGGKNEIPSNFRVIAAANVDLGAEVRAKRFRPDLYYRLNVGRIDMPPLRDRREDIPLLTDHLLARFAQEMGKPKRQIAQDALEVLSAYPWPGNVRELQNILKRVVAMSRREVLSVDDLPDEIVTQAGAKQTVGSRGFFAMRAQRVGAFEREYLKNLMQSCDGDISEAAKKARLPRGTLYRLMKKHSLSPEDFRAGSSGTAADDDSMPLSGEE